MFKKKNNENGVRDDELDTPSKKKSLFKKKNDDNGVDYNNTYLQNNSRSKESSNIVRNIVIFVIFVLIIIFVVPRLLHYDNSSKKKYIEQVDLMVEQVRAYYDREDVICTTPSKDRYYFDVNNSSDIFGEDVKSPFIKNALEGFIELDVKSDDSYTVYVSFSDGLFGFKRVEYSKLKTSDIGFFPYLSLEHHEEMICNPKFVFSN